MKNLSSFLLNGLFLNLSRMFGCRRAFKWCWDTYLHPFFQYVFFIFRRMKTFHKTFYWHTHKNHWAYFNFWYLVVLLSYFSMFWWISVKYELHEIHWYKRQPFTQFCIFRPSSRLSTTFAMKPLRQFGPDFLMNHPSSGETNVCFDHDPPFKLASITKISKMLNILFSWIVLRIWLIYYRKFVQLICVGQQEPRGEGAYCVGRNRENN